MCDKLERSLQILAHFLVICLQTFRHFRVLNIIALFGRCMQQLPASCILTHLVTACIVRFWYQCCNDASSCEMNVKSMNIKKLLYVCPTRQPGLGCVSS